MQQRRFIPFTRALKMRKYSCSFYLSFWFGCVVFGQWFISIDLKKIIEETFHRKDCPKVLSLFFPTKMEKCRLWGVKLGRTVKFASYSHFISHQNLWTICFRFLLDKTVHSDIVELDIITTYELCGSWNWRA